MKIISYNVNGLRSAISKDFFQWVVATEADVICLQEIKTLPHQVDISFLTNLGYSFFWHPAQKPGYSGVAIFTKTNPINVQIGMDNELYDNEGRVIRADFESFSLMNVYMPSGSSGDHRQSFKFKWLEDFYNYIEQLKNKIPNLIICGDYNICHAAIDIHNPKSNANSSGFLPEERAWIGKFIDSGFTDSFRHLNKEPHNYTWWSYRAGSRKKNLGWRIDYHMVSNCISDRIVRSEILSQAMHSDHAPILLEIN
jgi:exodeoxyribonuclease III